MPVLNQRALRIASHFAWLCFAVSFLLPAVRIGSSNSDVFFGWGAFWFAFGECADLLRWPPHRIHDPSCLVFITANVFALFVPLVLGMRPRWGAYFGWPVLVGGIVALIRYGATDKDLLIGYYLWVASLLALGTLCLLHSGWKFWRAFDLEK
ncbi:MAG: hypothetical protein HY301_13850 [Verrucomicrobia bacterium]|nr:hypothetical protein [Verrucomicrobiota bacterium]